MPLVVLVSIMFDGTRLRQVLPAADAVRACLEAPELGVTVYRRWIEWGGVDAGLWR